MPTTVRGMELTRLSPYTKKFIAYPIRRGKLDGDFDVQLTGDYLDTKNSLVMHRIEMGERVDNPDAPNLPVEFGLSLLSDSEGTVRLNVPVTGNLSNPQFELGDVIGKAVSGLIVNIVTAPFSIFANIFGGSGDDGGDLRFIQFAPGSAQMTTRGKSDAEVVAEAMLNRPRIALTMKGLLDPEEDRRAALEAKFDRTIKKYKFQDVQDDGQAPASVDEVVVDPAEYEEYLTEAYEEEPFEKPENFIGITLDQPVEEMERRLREYLAVDDAALAQLAQKRVDTLRSHLGGLGVDEGRMSLMDSIAGEPGDAGAEDVEQKAFSGVKLGLEGM
jgi:hypothetical protein